MLQQIYQVMFLLQGGPAKTEDAVLTATEDGNAVPLEDASDALRSDSGWGPHAAPEPGDEVPATSPRGVVITVLVLLAAVGWARRRNRFARTR